jgi:hypothetical protein
VQQEGFESNEAWGSVRSSIVDGLHAAPAVTHLGITWTSNFMAGEITTSEGAARRGSWGVYAYPHGQYATGANCTLPGVCGDGFVGEAAQGLFAIGGWITTNTPPADLNLFIDGTPLDFGNAGVLSTGYSFFGAISSSRSGASSFAKWKAPATKPSSSLATISVLHSRRCPNRPRRRCCCWAWVWAAGGSGSKGAAARRPESAPARRAGRAGCVSSPHPSPVPADPKAR